MANIATFEDPICPVGYNGTNMQSEVVKVHRALARIPALQNTLGPNFNVNQFYKRNSVTDQAIFKFQKDVMCLPTNMCDATVNPGGQTWLRMKAAAGASLAPAPAPAPAPAAPAAPTTPVTQVQPRKLIAYVSDEQVGTRYVKGYRISPSEASNGRFLLPTFRMYLGHANDQDEIVDICKEYEVLRHGVSYNKDADVPGARFDQIFKVMNSTPLGVSLLTFVPNFHHDARNPAWRFNSNYLYLIHYGPGYSKTYAGEGKDGSGLTAGLGCAMLCNYSSSVFSADVREFSLGKEYRDTGDEGCRTISDKSAFKVYVEAAPPPLLVPYAYDDWSSIGGPKGISIK